MSSEDNDQAGAADENEASTLADKLVALTPLQSWKAKAQSFNVRRGGKNGAGGGASFGGGKSLRWALIPITALAVWILAETVSFYVPPSMVGIRQVYFGSHAGIRKETYGPGLYLMIPGIERMHLFPVNLQIVNFSDSERESTLGFKTAPGVKIQTSDGYNVQLDVSVQYTIHDAYRVIVEAGPGRAFEDRLVVPRADRFLRKNLGELNSEEFYQGPQRIDKARHAEQQLAEDLKPFGITVGAVLVRRYTYDERYQSLIEGRKIKDQTVFLRQAEAKAAIEERKRDTIIAEGVASVEVELARGAGEVKKIDSQGNLYRRMKSSEGQLKIELAEAKGTQLENDALQGAGSENMVGLKMAEVLKGVDSLVLSSSGKDGLNPLDLASVLAKFEVK